MFGTRREWGLELAVSTCGGLFLGMTGPFGSYSNGSRLVIVAYWVGALWAGTILFGMTLRPAIQLARRWHLPVAAALATATPVVAVPMALLCHWAAATLWPAAIAGIGLLAWYGQTLVISVPLAACYGLKRGDRRSVPGPPPAALREPGPGRFLDRLPSGLGRGIIALQMEDHYVRVHTAAGSSLMLIPLRQAVDELAASGVQGSRVHRSWWVARRAVAGVDQAGRNVRLRLINGLQAPVARQSVAELRAAGWLDDPRPE